MKIEVTEQDIELGNPCDPCMCPIARAIERATGIEPIVSGEIFYLGFSSQRYHLPMEAVKWMGDFDAGKEEMQPFSFEVNS